MTAPDLDPERYAAGLPLVSDRSLTESERAWLRRRIRAATAVGIGVALGIALSLLAAWQLGVAVPSLGTELGGPAGIWLAGAGAIGCLLGLRRGGWARAGAGLTLLYFVGLAAVGALVPELTDRPHLFTKIVLVGAVGMGTIVLMSTLARRLVVVAGLRRVHADLRRGRVECFEGVAPGPTPALRSLRAHGYEPSAEGRPVRLEVLPSSGLIVRAAGRRCAPWIRVHLAQVAAGQPHALRVGLPEGVAPTSAAGRLNLRRRSLSPSERAELDRHIQRLRRRPWGAVAATVGLSLAVWWQLRGEPAGAWSLVERLLDPMMLGWYALALLTVVAYARRTIAARKLDDDLRLRWVVTVDDDDEAQGALSPPRLEVLPVSQLAWTENATPASWRTSKF